MDCLQQLAQRILPSDPKAGKIGSIELNLWLLHFTGLPIIGLKPESLLLKVCVLLWGVPTVIFVTILYFMMEINDVLLSWRDLDALTQNSCLSLTHLSSLYKIANTFYRLSEIKQLIQNIEQLTKTHVHSPKQMRVFYHGEFENKLILILYFGLVAFPTTLAMIMLFYNPNELAGKRFPYRVRMPDWLPMQLQWTYMGVGVVLISLEAVTIDYLNISLMNQIRLQLKVLNLSFDELTLRDNVDVSLEQELISINANKRITTITEHHCALLNLRQNVEDIFSIPVLVQFCSSLIIIAMAGFQAIVGDGSNSSRLIYSYCSCVLSQLFLYCWCGNEVSEQSKTLSTTGFTSTWYRYDSRFKKSLMIFITNAQKPFVFTAGGFMDLSLQSFSGILSKSYSVIAVLRQTYIRENK